MAGISPAAQAAWERLQQIYGGPLSVTSGYRDPAKNAAVGGAKGSQHMHGNAFDVSAAGMSEADRLALASAARDAGFQGFGFYDNSMHFDVGGSRAWGPSYGRESIPGYAQDWVSQNVGGGAAPQSGGAPMGLLSVSTKGMPEQPQTFGQRIKSGFQDGSLFDSMAMAFNGLRMNPDQNLGQVVGQRQEARQQEDVMNRTVAWLQSMGTPQAMQAAEALATGSIDAGSAVQYALKEAPAPGVNVVDGKLVSDTGEVLYGPTGADGAPVLDKEGLGGLNVIRDDVRSQTATFPIVQNGWKNLSAFYDNPGAVSDYALAVAFAKIVDPGSVAREGEVAAVANSGARFPGLTQSLQNAITGEGALTPEVRMEIAQLARNMYVNAATETQAVIANGQKLAEAAGLPPQYVYMGSEIQMPGPVRPPAPRVAAPPPSGVVPPPVVPTPFDTFQPAVR